MSKHLIAALIAGGLVYVPAKASQDPLAARTLIVYDQNSADSLSIKDYYIGKRFDPSSVPNVCALALPNSAAADLSKSDYITYVKTPIQNCLNTAGKTNILYILLAYVRPYRVVVQNSLVYYALDSYLADIWDQNTTTDFNPFPTGTHRYYTDVQNQGMVYTPFQSFATYRASPRSLLYYAVWRLDGATPTIAKGLVDKATSAMNNLTGAVCIDTQSDPSNSPDSAYAAGEWDLHRAAQFMGQASFAVTEDQHPQEFGTSPAPLKCPPDGGPLALYSGWYSLNRYNGTGVFNWAPGAIGVHLDSVAAADPRGGPNWAANALLEGITVTSGAVAEPYLEGIPRPAGLFRNLLEGANVADAFLRNTRWVKWMILNVGDPLYRPFPATGLAPFNPPAPLNSLGIATRELVGGLPTTGTLTLAAAAPVGGTTFSLSSNNPSAAAVPASVMVSAGAKSATFPITTTAQIQPVDVIVTAVSGSTNLANSLRVDPLISYLILSQSKVSGGQPIAGTVYLNGSAPVGGATVALSSSDTSTATVPASIFVPAGQAKATFPITTSSTSVPKSTIIRATNNGTTVEATLTDLPAMASVTVNPAAANPGAGVGVEFYLSVVAPAGGATVTIGTTNPAATIGLPASAFIPAGTTYGGVTFTAGASGSSSTISVSYGGDTKTVAFNVN